MENAVNVKLIAENITKKTKVIDLNEPSQY